MINMRCFVHLLLIALLILNNAVFSQSLEDLFHDKKEIYFKFKFQSVNKTNNLSNIISIDHKTNKENVYAYATKNEFKAFLKCGIAYELVEELIPHYTNASGSKNNWDYYPTYSEYTQMMEQFADSFPDICKLHNLGTLTSGRKILCVQISSNVGVKSNKPSFLYTSSMHGNELTGYVLMLRLIDDVLSGYNTCLLYTSPSPRDRTRSRMPSSA